MKWTDNLLQEEFSQEELNDLVASGLSFRRWNLQSSTFGAHSKRVKLQMTVFPGLFELWQT